MRTTWIVVLCLGITPLGCHMSDSDRCSEGRVWVEAYSGCVEPDQIPGAGGENPTGAAGQAGQAGTPTGSDEGGSAGATDVPNDTGLGASCPDTSACTSADATFCLKDPLNPTAPGICTIANCTSEACGEAFDCCDCTSSVLLGSVLTAPVCAPLSNVSDLTTLAGCTCS
jgi:hypothetical protein